MLFLLIGRHVLEMFLCFFNNLIIQKGMIPNSLLVYDIIS